MNPALSTPGQDTASTPHAATEEIRALLSAIFADGRAADLLIVLRNGELLPGGMTGTDLDVSVRPAHTADEVAAFLGERGATVGWTSVCVSRRPHMTGLSLVSPPDASGEVTAIHFDIFAGISYLCLPLLPPAALDAESVVVAGVRQLTPRGRALTTAMHHLAWNGALLKDKYRSELLDVLSRPADGAWLLEHVDGALGGVVSRDLRVPDRVQQLGTPSAVRRGRIQIGTIAHWLLRRPRSTLGAVARYALGQLDSFRHPPGLVGTPGDRLPGHDQTRLTLGLACRISPHAAGAEHVRVSARRVRTLNGPRYERTTASLWRGWTLVRWLWPSLFLYIQAKRNRIVVLDRLPLGLQWLRATPWAPAWLCRAGGATGRSMTGVLAGLCDTGLSSLATFASGMFAARMLHPADLGSYALVFSAFVIAAMVPAQAVFTPAEVAALAAPQRERGALIGRTVRLGVPIALLSALGMIAWIVVAPPETAADVLVALTVSGAVTALVSPIQDHLRRMLHLADASWNAALVSLVHFGTLMGALVLGVVADVPPAWMPLGALALANVVSLGVGLGLARGSGPVPAVPLALRGLVRDGRWLLAIGLLPTVTGFGAAVLISRLANVAALGHAEAARILTQPLFVLSTGLSAFLGPRSMEAGRSRIVDQARRISNVFVALVLVTGIPYLLLIGVRWSWSPLPGLVPTAYAVDGLVAATAVAMIVAGLVFPSRSELLGAGRARTLAEVEAAGNALRLGIAGFAGALGAFAAPVGMVCLGLVRGGGYWAALRRHYAGPAAAVGEPVHIELGSER